MLSSNPFPCVDRTGEQKRAGRAFSWGTSVSKIPNAAHATRGDADAAADAANAAGPDHDAQGLGWQDQFSWRWR